MGVSLIELAIVILGIFGGFGLPVGVPPGEEDPRMAALAPESCLYYAAWSGVADPVASGNPTEQWLARPGIKHFLEVLPRAIESYGLREVGLIDNKAQRLAAETITSIVYRCLENPASIYISDLEMTARGFERVEGAIVVAMGLKEQAIRKQMSAWADAVKADALGKKFQVAEDANNRLIIRCQWAPDVITLVRLQDDLAVIATSMDQLNQVDRNLSTPPPKWLSEIRKRFPVKRFCSVGYVRAMDILEEMGADRNAPFIDFLQIVRDATELESVASVAGFDDEGFLCRTEFVIRDVTKSVFSPFDREPIPLDELKRIRTDRVLALATRLDAEAILQAIKNVSQNPEQRHAVETALQQFEDFSGLELETEVLNTVGDLVTLEFDFPLLSSMDWFATVSIEDEMTFPAVFEQINQATKEALENLNGESKLEKQDIDGLTVYRFESGLANQFVSTNAAWAVDDLLLLIGETADTVVQRTQPIPDQQQLSRSARVREMYAFGEKNQLKGPLAVIQFDLARVVKRLAVFVENLRMNGDQNIMPRLDLTWNDIPPANELHEGVGPNVTALFRSTNGFELVQRQTYPGSSPIVTTGALVLLASFAALK